MNFLKDKNTLLGISLITMMVSLYMLYYTYTQQKIEENKRIEATVQKAQKSTNPNSNTTLIAAGDSVKTTSLDTLQPLNKLKNGIAETTVLENSLFKVRFSTKGGKITDVELKKHTDASNKPVHLLSENHADYYVQLQNEGSTINTSELYYTLGSHTDSSIEYQVTLPNGVVLKNSYTISTESYSIKYNAGIEQNKTAQKAFLVAADKMPKIEHEAQRERQYSNLFFENNNEKETQKLDISKNETQKVEAPIQWFAHKQQFFNYFFIGEKPFLNGEFTAYFDKEDTAFVKQFISKVAIDVPAGNSTTNLTLFVGPSDYNILRKMKFGEEKVVSLSPDFILFRWTKIFNEYFIIPLFNFLGKFISSYGIIILLMTVLLKLVTLPFQMKTFKSGVISKILKPELEELKKKHGNDQQKFAQEQMKLMSQVGANPLGGCLPMLLQLPVLIAMANFFPASIELRHQPFLWAHDLSMYDNVINFPFSIPLIGSHLSLFTILMAITQIITTWYMQKMQPASPANDQMKGMMYIMPVMMLFMFNGLPAAMTYYYLLQNILSVAVQYGITNFVLDEDKIRAEMEANKKKPKSEGILSRKMNDLMKQAEEAKKVQENQKKK